MYTYTQTAISRDRDQALQDLERAKIQTVRADQIAQEERDRRVEAAQDCEKLQEQVLSLKALVTREGLVHHPTVRFTVYVCLFSVCMRC